jgi:ribonuclease G
MSDSILINRTFNETRIAFLKNDKIFELYVERTTRPKFVGNIYKARVSKVIPGMQAAFVDYGEDRAGFISAEDVYNDEFENIFLEQEDEIQKNKFNNYLIQDILREGQEILIQVLKNPSGTKGAKLTSNLALPGKYLVLLCMVDFVGVSKRIEGTEERERLTELLNKIKPEGIGFIARTASEGVAEKYIENDLNQLVNKWNLIKSKADKSKTPLLLYREPSLFLKVIRDIVSDTTRVIIDSQEHYDQITEFIKEYFPEMNIQMEMYQDASPMFVKYGLENEIEKIYNKKVWLKSGGYLIIEEAEALTVIDVNTGKYLSGDSQNETIYHIDKEAAVEIAKQIKIRNLVGIIVIDFIDIKDAEKSQEIYETFIEEMKDDKARTVIYEMSQFSVIQLTRQKLRESILEYLTVDCPGCHGTGYIKSPETLAYEIIRDVMHKVHSYKYVTFKVIAPSRAIEYIKRYEEANIMALEEKNNIQVLLEASDADLKSYDIIVE